MAKSVWPTAADVTGGLTALGVTVPSGVDAGDLIDGAVSEFERRTGWTVFLAEASPSTYTYDTDGSAKIVLPDPFFAATAVVVDGVASVIGTDVFLGPTGAPTRGRPYTYLDFLAVPVAYKPGLLAVTGKRGYTDDIPVGVWNAVLGQAIAQGLMAIANTPGMVKRIKQDSVEIEFNSAAGQSYIDRLQNDFDKAITQYVRRG